VLINNQRTSKARIRSPSWCSARDCLLQSLLLWTSTLSFTRVLIYLLVVSRHAAGRRSSSWYSELR